MEEKKKIKRMSDVLTHLRKRTIALGIMVDYYEQQERDKGALTMADEFAYQIAKSKLNEVINLVDFIEGGE